MDADYNGWWFCLIPTEVVRDVGLSLPAFIKWDDAEYCLRARDAGYPTVTLPGTALWHVSWLDKDDSIDWQAYFHARNRIVAALLHSPHAGGGSLTSDSERWDLKHLLSMQYYPVTLRHRALRDILSGPAHMQAGMPTILGELRAAAAELPREDRAARRRRDPDDRRGQARLPGAEWHDGPKGPRGIPLALFTVKMTARQWFTNPAARTSQRRRWSSPSATARGSGCRTSTVHSSRRPTVPARCATRVTETFRRLLPDSRRLHRELKRRWPELSREYRAALPEITSPEAWREHFPGSPRVDRPRKPGGRPLFVLGIRSGERGLQLVVVHRQRRADRHVHVEVLVGAEPSAEEHVRLAPSRGRGSAAAARGPAGC